MTNLATIREERHDDIAQIRAVTFEAFQSSELGHHGEADLIDRLRQGCPNRLSLVAETRGRVVGHVLFTPVVIQTTDRKQLDGMGLAPLSVLPELQRGGIGTLLVAAGLERLRSARCPFVVVIGYPEFYGHRGFEPAGDYGVSCEFEDIPSYLVQIAVLESESSRIPPGVAKYHSAFSDLE